MSKEILKKLLKIADNQQKIITKLAQDVSEANMAPFSNKVELGDFKTKLEADLLDMVYGRGVKVPANRLAVHYVAKRGTAPNNELVIGLTVPDNMENKWLAMKNNVETALKSKYGVSKITWMV